MSSARAMFDELPRHMTDLGVGMISERWEASDAAQLGIVAARVISCGCGQHDEGGSMDCGIIGLGGGWRSRSSRSYSFRRKRPDRSASHYATPGAPASLPCRQRQLELANGGYVSGCSFNRARQKLACDRRLLLRLKFAYARAILELGAAPLFYRILVLGTPVDDITIYQMAAWVARQDVKSFPPA